MRFITLEPEEFRKFTAKSPYRSFYQTPEIATLRAGNGWTPYYFGVEENKKLLAASLVVAKPAFLGKSVYYAPGGPLLDLENTALTQFFFKNLKKYAKSHNGYVLHIEPYYEKIARDRSGEPLENGFNRTKAVQNLHNCGFKSLPHSDEPKYSFAMNLKGQTAEQIFSDMKRNTRGHIRKAEKQGVKIRELGREELGIFKQITESTSTRRNFQDKPLSYYEQMYDLFHPRGEVMFLLAETSGEGVTDDVFFKDSRRLDRSETYILSATEEAARRADFPGRPAYDVEDGLAGPEKDMSVRTPSPIPLSAAMFILYGSEVIYLFSGSDERYMKEYNAQYLIQWHMIKYALEHEFDTYNFYGIQGLPDKSSKDYGIYDFKKGFTSDKTGRVIELIGAHELPVDPVLYHIHRFLSKLRHRQD